MASRSWCSSPRYRPRNAFAGTAGWHRADRFATNTYRDMPFLLCSLLWDQLSSRFRTRDPLRERAHGDDISINSNSPEDFEDILWKAFWPKKCRSDRILQWSKQDRDAEFERFYRSNMRKAIALRPRPSAGVTHRKTTLISRACRHSHHYSPIAASSFRCLIRGTIVTPC